VCVAESVRAPPATGGVAEQEEGELWPLHATAAPGPAELARLQSGVLGAVKQCTGTWCRIVGAGFDGWIAQERVWGVYPSEKVE